MARAPFRDTLCAVALLTAGCAEDPPAPPRGGQAKPPTAAAQPSEPEPVVKSLGEIAGPWDIVRFGDYGPPRLTADGLRRAYVHVRADGLAYVIECNYSGNPARIDEQGVLHDTGDGSRMSTCMLCDPERDAREGAFFSFFATKPKVTRTRDGQLRLANGRTELILERPDTRRLANVPSLAEIAGRWLPRMGSRAYADGGHEGYGFQDGGVVTITGDRLSYSGCGGAAVTFRYTNEGRMVTTGRVDPARCGEDQAETRLLEIMDAGPLVERTPGGIALSANGLVVGLQSEAELRRQRNMPPLPAPPGSPSPPPPQPLPSPLEV